VQYLFYLGHVKYSDIIISLIVLPAEK